MFKFRSRLIYIVNLNVKIAFFASLQIAVDYSYSLQGVTNPDVLYKT